MTFNIISFSNHALSFFQESALTSLTAQQKKILIVASIAFGFIAVCYVACDCWLKDTSNVENDDENIKLEDLEKENYTQKDFEAANKIPEVNDGLELFYENKYSEASEKFEKALEIDPENGYILFYYATAMLMQQGITKEVDQIFDQAHQRFGISSKKQNKEVDILPKTTKADSKKIIEAAEQACLVRDYENASIKYQEALAIDKKSPLILGSYAEILYELKDYDNALKNYEIALENDKENASIIGGVASILFVQERYNDAIIEYLTSLAIEPENAFLLCGYGATLFQLGYYDKAALCFEKALSLETDNKCIIYCYAATLRKQNKHNEALNLMKNCIELKEKTLNSLNFVQTTKEILMDRRFEKFANILYPQLRIKR